MVTWELGRNVKNPHYGRQLETLTKYISRSRKIATVCSLPSDKSKTPSNWLEEKRRYQIMKPFMNILYKRGQYEFTELFLLNKFERKIRHKCLVRLYDWKLFPVEVNGWCISEFPYDIGVPHCGLIQYRGSVGEVCVCRGGFLEGSRVSRYRDLIEGMVYSELNLFRGEL